MMLTTRSMRGTALLAAAFTLAACGSDKAAGPSTANNDQIIAEMNATLADPASFDSTTGMYKYIGLQLAVAGLSSGAPVNPGNVTLDGHSYRFSTTGLVMEERDSVSGDVRYRVGVIVGWRHTNGDSVFIALYAPEPELATDRRTPVSLMQREPSSTAKLADMASLLRSGRYTVSKSLSAAGPDEPALIALYLGGSFYAAMVDDGIASGSISYAAASGECDLEGAAESDFLDVAAASCEMVRSNASLTANTYDPMSESDPQAAGPVFGIPAQSVFGVKFIAEGGGPPA
jgi:hypothetical protein